MIDLDTLQFEEQIVKEGPWSSMYHNRTESWAITYPAYGCDTVNDMANVIAAAPDGQCHWQQEFDFIVNLRNAFPKLAEELAAARVCVEATRAWYAASEKAWEGTSMSPPRLNEIRSVYVAMSAYDAVLGTAAGRKPLSKLRVKSEGFDGQPEVLAGLVKDRPLADRVHDRMRFIAANREELLEAWIAKHQVPVEHACLVEQQDGVMTTKVWVEVKTDRCKTHRAENEKLQARVRELEDEAHEQQNHIRKLMDDRKAAWDERYFARRERDEEIRRADLAEKAIVETRILADLRQNEIVTTIAARDAARDENKKLADKLEAAEKVIEAGRAGMYEWFTRELEVYDAFKERQK